MTEFSIEPIMDVARRAGDLVLQMQRDGLHQIRNKSSAIDLVTEADVASEQLIQRELAALYPDVAFWGEESGGAPDADRFWLVDPIDGTTNYANGIPFFAISIALCRPLPDHGIEPLLGLVLELPAGRAFWAQQGRGAFVRTVDEREQPLRVNAESDLCHALLSTGFPYHRTESTDNNTTEFAYFLSRCQGVRSMGSAALDLAYVARGVFAGYWEGWLGPWDAAAGVLLVREAGGCITDYGADPWRLQNRGMIASNGQPAIHQALVDGIRHARRDLSERRLDL